MLLFVYRFLPVLSMYLVQWQLRVLCAAGTQVTNPKLHPKTFTSIGLHLSLSVIQMDVMPSDLIGSGGLFSLCPFWSTGAFLKSLECLSWAAMPASASSRTGSMVYSDNPDKLGACWAPTCRRYSVEKLLSLILRIFTKFFVFRLSLLFYGFPLQVRFTLCNCVQSAQELKAFSTKYFLWVLKTSDKFNQKQLFKSFCRKYWRDTARKACVCASFFFVLFMFSLSSFFVLTMRGQKIYFDALDFCFWIPYC